jgi:hypothetical protein
MCVVPFDIDVGVLENRNASVKRVEKTDKRFQYVQLYTVFFVKKATQSVELNV